MTTGIVRYIDKYVWDSTLKAVPTTFMGVPVNRITYTRYNRHALITHLNIEREQRKPPVDTIVDIHRKIAVGQHVHTQCRIRISNGDISASKVRRWVNGAEVYLLGNVLTTEDAKKVAYWLDQTAGKTPLSESEWSKHLNKRIEEIHKHLDKFIHNDYHKFTKGAITDLVSDPLMVFSGFSYQGKGQGEYKNRFERRVYYQNGSFSSKPRVS